MQPTDLEPDDPRAQARTLNDRGEAALRDGDIQAAEAVLQEAVDRWRAIGDRGGLAEALHNLAVARGKLKQQQAVPLLEEAIRLLQATGDRATEAISRHALGSMWAELGDYPRALAQLEQALQLRHAVGNWRGTALTLEQLARVCDLTGERLRALDYRRQALDAVRTGDDRSAEAEALCETARAALAVGQDADAFTGYEQAAAIYEALGDQRGLGKTLLALGQAYFEAGDMAAATAPIERALPLLRATGAWDNLAAQWEGLLQTNRLTGQIHGMLDQWQRGRKPDVDAIRSDVQQRLAEQPEEPIGQMLGMLAGALDGFATLTPRRPLAQPPTAAALAASDTRSVDELLAALQDPSQKERRRAALALRLRGDTRAVEPLIAATRDRSQWVRRAAVRALGKLRDARALDALIARLEDRDKDVRRSAATALGALREVRAADALTMALTDTWWRVEESAEKALRKLRVGPRVAVLVELLQHADPARRGAAAARLGDLGDREAVEPLLVVAESRAQPDVVRVAALKAMAKLGDRRAAEVALRMLHELDAPPAGGISFGSPALLRGEAAAIIATVGDASAGPALVEQLRDGNPYVRHAAIQALGAVGNTSAIPALEHLQQTDPDSVQVDLRGMQRVRLRSAALEAIQRIRERHAEAAC